MITKFAQLLLAFLLSIVGPNLPSFAEEISVDIGNAVVITNPNSSVSHFLAMPLLDLPDSSMVVDRAVLDLWVEPETEDTITFAAVTVYPLISNWSVNDVSWSSPWTNPGGDIDNTFYAEYAINTPGLQSIEIDLTDLVMRWVDGRMAYYGFMIMVSDGALATLNFTNGPDGNGPFATLRITYTSIQQEP
jgi:hypothetical protein